MVAGETGATAPWGWATAPGSGPASASPEGEGAGLRLVEVLTDHTRVSRSAATSLQAVLARRRGGTARHARVGVHKYYTISRPASPRCA